MSEQAGQDSPTGHIGSNAGPSRESLPWWKSGVMYNLYVRSYRDSDGDGVGDLPGVIEKLDYLRNLGIDMIWLSGMLDSPWREFGFDVRDFTAVHPAMGNEEVFRRLLEEAHARGMKVMIDYIPNHSSSDHPWFLESRSSRDNPKRDWYLWCDPRPDGGPPNNWLSPFGGSMWKWDEATGQFYLHTFLEEQPDLNWRNPQVVEAMRGVLRYWLDLGVDGFRVDAAHHIIKDLMLRDNPPNPWAQQAGGRVFAHETQFHIYDREQFELHAIYQDLRRTLDEYSRDGQERAWVAEIHPAGWAAWIQYFGHALNEFHFPFSNGFVFTEWKALPIRIMVDTIEAYMPPGAWPNAHTGNFDETRVATRLGKEQARVAAMAMLTLRGTPVLYYGEEIGMRNGEIPEERIRDRMGIQIGNHRDPQRTPMQWNAGESAGFSDVPGTDTWLPLAADYAEINVDRLWQDEKSILALYRRLIACRRETPALVGGSYRPVETPMRDVFAYLRELDGERMFVALNFSDQLLTLPLPMLGRGRAVISTRLDREEDVTLAALELRPHEGLLVRLSDG